MSAVLFSEIVEEHLTTLAVRYSSATVKGEGHVLRRIRCHPRVDQPQQMTNKVDDAWTMALDWPRRLASVSNPLRLGSVQVVQQAGRYRFDCNVLRAYRVVGPDVGVIRTGIIDLYSTPSGGPQVSPGLPCLWRSQDRPSQSRPPIMTKGPFQRTCRLLIRKPHGWHQVATEELGGRWRAKVGTTRVIATSMEAAS